MATIARRLEGLLAGVFFTLTAVAAEDPQGPTGVPMQQAVAGPAAPDAPAWSTVTGGYRSVHFEQNLATSSFNFPFQITVSGVNVFVSDVVDQVVRQYQLTAAGPTFVRNLGSPGSAAGQFSGPEQVAVVGGDIYVADFNNNRIQRFNMSTGTYVSQFGASGSGAGQFSSPSGLVYNPVNGLLYVSEVGNDRVQMFSLAGIYQGQFAAPGSGNGQLNNPFVLAVDSAGNIYAADSANNRVSKFDRTGNWLRHIASGVSSPLGVAVDPADSVWVTSSTSGNVYAYDSRGNYLSYYYGSGPFPTEGYFVGMRGIALTRPLDFAPYFGNSAVIVADGTGKTVQVFSTSLQPTAHPPMGTISGVGNFNGQVAFDSASNVYFTDFSGNRVLKYDRFGNFVTQWGSSGIGNGQFNGAYGITIDDSDNVYVVDRSNHRVQKFDANGAYLLQFGSVGSGNGQFNNPAMIATDGSWLYVSDEVNHRVQKFSLSGTYVRQWGTMGSGDGQMRNPAGIAVDRKRNQVYVAEFNGHRIQQFSVFGDFVKVLADSTSGSGALTSPRGLATDQQGNLYVADGGNSRVVQFNDNGTYLGNFAISSPNGVGVDVRSEQIHVGSFNGGGVQHFGSIVGKNDHVGLYRSSTYTFLLRDTNTSGAPFITATVALATAADVPIVGDWNGDGIDTPGLYRSTTGVFYLWEKWRGLSIATPDHVFSFGALGDRPVVGDWDGDGKDGIGTFRPSTGALYFKNRIDGASSFDYVVGFGAVASDISLAGDWNGDGNASGGFFRPGNTTFYLANRLGNGSVPVDGTYGLGGRNDQPFAGDWNHAGFNGLGVYRPSTGSFQLKYDLNAAPADLTFSFDGDLMFRDGFELSGGGDFALVGQWGNAPE